VNFINDFEDFLLESLDTTFFIISEKLFDVLIEINHPISIELRQGESQLKKKVTLIDIAEDEYDKWNFVNSVKANQYMKEVNMNLTKLQSLYITKNVIKDKFTSKAKIGRIINKIYPDKYSSAEIEKFVNEYKKFFTKDFDLIKIVKGRNINKWYDQVNYNREETTSSELQGSCMASSSKNKFMDLYSMNPDNISMVVLFSDSDKTKIDARALLWKPDTIDGKENTNGDLFMDRVYFNKQAHKTTLHKYAENNKWFYKPNNDSSYMAGIYNPHTKKVNNVIFQIKDIKIPNHHQVPYADTFVVFDPETNILSNNEKERKDVNGIKKLGYLTSTSGSFDDVCWVENRNRYYHTSDVIAAMDVGDVYKQGIKGDAIYLDRYSTYYTQEYLDSEKNEKVYDPVQYEEMGEKAPKYTVFSKDVKELENGERYLKKDLKHSVFLDIYIPKNKAVYSNYMGSYLPMEDTIKVITDILRYPGNEIGYSYDYRLIDEPQPSFFKHIDDKYYTNSLKSELNNKRR